VTPLLVFRLVPGCSAKKQLAEKRVQPDQSVWFIRKLDKSCTKGSELDRDTPADRRFSDAPQAPSSIEPV